MKCEQTPEKPGRKSSKPPAQTPPPARRYKSSEPEAAEGSHTEGALPSTEPATPEKKTPIKEEPSETRRSEYRLHLATLILFLLFSYVVQYVFIGIFLSIQLLANSA